MKHGNGWDGAARQGSCMGEKMAKNCLTERSDLKSGRAGWEGAVKGTEKRVKAKLGSSLDGPR